MNKKRIAWMVFLVLILMLSGIACSRALPPVEPSSLKRLAPNEPVPTANYKMIVRNLPDQDQREVMKREKDWKSVYDQFMAVLGP